MKRLTPLSSRASSEIASWLVKMTIASIYVTESSEEDRGLRIGVVGEIYCEIKIFNVQKNGWSYQNSAWFGQVLFINISTDGKTRHGPVSTPCKGKLSILFIPEVNLRDGYRVMAESLEFPWWRWQMWWEDAFFYLSLPLRQLWNRRLYFSVEYFSKGNVHVNHLISY